MLAKSMERTKGRCKKEVPKENLKVKYLGRCKKEVPKENLKVKYLGRKILGKVKGRTKRVIEMARKLGVAWEPK